MAQIDVPDSPLMAELNWGQWQDANGKSVWGYTGSLYWNGVHIAQYRLGNEDFYLAQDELNEIIADKLRKVFE